MRVQDVMNTHVATINKNNSAEEAWNLMKLRDIHHLVVIEGQTMTGVISQRDLGGENGIDALKNNTVGDLMTPRVIFAHPRTTLREAANLLRGDHISCLPVFDDEKRLVGIITTTDLLNLIGQGIERIVSDTERRTVRVDPTQDKIKVH